MKRRSAKYDEALVMAVCLASFGIAAVIGYGLIWLYG